MRSPFRVWVSGFDRVSSGYQVSTGFEWVSGFDSGVGFRRGSGSRVADAGVRGACARSSTPASLDRARSWIASGGSGMSARCGVAGVGKIGRLRE